MRNIISVLILKRINYERRKVDNTENEFWILKTFNLWILDRIKTKKSISSN